MLEQQEHIHTDRRHYFLSLALKLGALRFGEFTLKSGRQSPYFFDIGRFATGQALMELGRAYANAISTASLDFDMLYGPAYKGIPLVTATAIALAEHYAGDCGPCVVDYPYAFNRKEPKEHGEGGTIVGNPLYGRVLIIDDVISAGTSVHESMAIIRKNAATPVGVVIALDRQEYVQDSLTVTSGIYGLPVTAILKFTDLLAYLSTRPDMAQDLQRMRSYQLQYSSRI